MESKIKILSISEAISTLEISLHLQEIIDHIQDCGGRSILVGGAVRDLFLGIKSKDFDIEIYHLEIEDLIFVLKKCGKVNLVGKSFGIILMIINGIEIDFSLPRTEQKTGEGHKGFKVNYHSKLSFKAASFRRDFTINTIGIDLKTKEILDPHAGLKDLRKGELRHVSKAFGEDPLRALRAVQFSARFGFSIALDTQVICSKQPLDELPKERLYEEFKKLLLKSKRPSIGMEWMRKMSLLRFFPELKNLIGVQQDSEWHSEGDVWTHNNMTLDQAALIRDQEISNQEENSEFLKMTLMLGALCHNLGKPLTTAHMDSRWRGPSHDIKGVEPTLSFLNRLTRDQKIISVVVGFVKEHLRPSILYRDRLEITDSVIRRLSLRVDIRALIRVAKADHFGRKTTDAIEKSFPAELWLKVKLKELGLDKERPKPMLTGKILKSYGISPGPRMGEIIREAFELQLEGQIKSRDDLTMWLSNNYIRDLLS